MFQKVFVQPSKKIDSVKLSVTHLTLKISNQASQSDVVRTTGSFLQRSQLLQMSS